MKKLIILVFITFIVISCTPTIDTSSDEKMKTSIAKVRKSLSDDQKEKFDKAVMALAFKGFSFNETLSDAGRNITEARMKDILNGKTGKEVIAEAKKVEKERISNDIKDLQKKKKQCEQDRTELERFIVSEASFGKYKGEYSFRSEPYIKMTVENLTNYVIGRAYFKGTLKSDDRSTPWIVETFNYKISGGLEPNESDSWVLAPNIFSEWGTTKAPKDAVLTVEVTRLDNMDEEKLFSINDFSEEDEEKLNELVKKLKLL